MIQNWVVKGINVAHHTLRGPGDWIAFLRFKLWDDFTRLPR